MAEEIIIKAAILEKLGAPLVVDKIIMPKKLMTGQVQVRVICSGICGTQIREIDAKEDKFLPHLLGHEGGGKVLNVGPGVMMVKPGDHVVMHWRRGAGIESNFPEYKWPEWENKAGNSPEWLRNHRDLGGGLVTTFNEHAVVSENRLTKIPRHIPFDIAALMGCAVTTAFGLIDNEAWLTIGQSIMILGCGGVGLNVIQAAAMKSAYPIIAVDVYDHKLDMALHFGATHTFNANKAGYADILSAIFTLTGSGVDVAVECSGKAEWVHEALKPGGRVILVGLPAADKALRMNNMRKLFGKTIILSEGGMTNPNDDIPRYLELYENKKMRLDELITHRYPLEEINSALDRVRSGECGRCVIDMEEKEL